MRKLTPAERMKRMQEFYTMVNKLGNPSYSELATRKKGETHAEFEIRKEKLTSESEKSHAHMVLNQLRSFIKVSYGSESEHLESIKNITFFQEPSGLFEVQTTESADRKWWQARNQLIQLIFNIIGEEAEQIRQDSTPESNRVPLRYIYAVFAMVITILAIWGSPKEFFFTIFDPIKIFKVRIAVTIAVGLLLLILVDRHRWKWLGSAAVLPLLFAILELMREDPMPEQITKRMDTIQVKGKQPQLLLHDSIKNVIHHMPLDTQKVKKRTLIVPDSNKKKASKILGRH